VIKLIAMREIRERVKSRAFKVGTGVQLALVIGLVAVFSLIGSGGDQSYKVGTLQGQTSPVLKVAKARQANFTAKLAAKTYRDEVALRRAVDDKTVDAGLTGTRLLARSDAPDRLVALLQSSAQTGRPSVTLQRVGTKADNGAGLAFVGTLLLYISLITFGFVLAGGIVEEKSSRVIEILLAAAKPLQLLAGKVVGVGLVGLGQLVLVVVTGVAAAAVAGSIDLPAATIGGAVLVVVYFVLGYAFYAMAFAAAASLVSRQEDIQSVTTPIMLVLIAGYIVSINAAGAPGSTLAQVAAFIPPVAPMTVPSIALQGKLSTVSLIVSIVLMLIAIAGMLVVASRIYERAILLTGAPLKLSQALRLLRRPAS
jgi:ABC-2 type transport system permease protein